MRLNRSGAGPAVPQHGGGGEAAEEVVRQGPELHPRQLHPPAHQQHPGELLQLSPTKTPGRRPGTLLH